MRAVATMMLFALVLCVTAATTPSPALAQGKLGATPTTTKKRAAPKARTPQQDAIRVEASQVAGYKQDRAGLRAQTRELFTVARVAREASTIQAQRAQLERLKRLHKGIDGALNRQAKRLGGGAMTGKQRQAFTLVQAIRSAHGAAHKDFKLAEAALKRGDNRAFSQHIGGAERHLGVMRDRAQSFGLLEPIIHR